MQLDTFKPSFLIQIEGQDLSKDITQEITAFPFTTNEDELDVLELCVTNRNLLTMISAAMAEALSRSPAGSRLCWFVGHYHPG